MVEKPRGAVDIVVCDSCNTLKPKALWLAGQCPACGHDSGAVRGYFIDSKYYIDGFLAGKESTSFSVVKDSGWADWCPNGVLTGTPR